MAANNALVAASDPAYIVATRVYYYFEQAKITWPGM